MRCFFLFSASLPGTSAAHKLVVAIRQKCTPEDVLNELKDLPNPRETSENDMVESTFNPLKIDVFVQTLLNLGSKSFSHTFAAISKFHLVFKVSCCCCCGNDDIETRSKTIGSFFLFCFVPVSLLYRRWPKPRKLRSAFCTTCLSCGPTTSRCWS